MNLFLVSNLGQLYHAQSLIIQKDFKRNCLAILYTDKNLEIVRQIEENINSELFELIKHIKLPPYPLKVNRIKLRCIKKTYSDLLFEVNPKCLFVCSYEHHYNLILEMAKKQKIKLVLFEEGTATYKDLIQTYNDWNRWKSVKDASVRYFKEIKKSSIRFISSILSEKEKTLIKKLRIGSEFKGVYNKYKEFDEIYVVFPEKAKLIFKAKHYYEINTNYNVNQEIQKILLENEVINEIDYRNSVIFVNQRYNVPNHIHIKIIISFLNEYFPNKKIFFKFHPKDSMKAKNDIISIIETQDIPIRVIDMEYEVPIEAIIKTKKPEYLVGISSTSLAYIKRNISDVKILSCADYYLEQISKIRKVKKQVMQEIRYHKKILESLGDIEIL